LNGSCDEKYTDCIARQRLYQAFPVREALFLELGWSYYNALVRLENPAARQWYLRESIWY
jgi:hypothetical protein